jgi:hypothetical protein
MHGQNSGKRVVVILIFCLLVPLLLCATEGVRLRVFLDAWAIDALWTKHIGIRGGVGAIMENGVGFSLPVYCLIDQSGGDEVLLDIALKLLCYPWKRGPFFSLSLAQTSLFIGPFVPDEQIHYLNEIGVGFTWEVHPNFYVEPEILYRDPSNTFPESFSYLNDFIPGYQKFQICLKVGWTSNNLAK